MHLSFVAYVFCQFRMLQGPACLVNTNKLNAEDSGNPNLKKYAILNNLIHQHNQYKMHTLCDTCCGYAFNLPCRMLCTNKPCQFSGHRLPPLLNT